MGAAQLVAQKFTSGAARPDLLDPGRRTADV